MVLHQVMASQFVSRGAANSAKRLLYQHWPFFHNFLETFLFKRAS
jgi:hypothetical protein